MKSLTKRETVLIYILICFGIIMGGLYLVVFPGYQKYQTLSDRLSEAQFQQSIMASAIEGVPAVMKTRDAANARLSVLEAPYSAHLPNEGLDILLTQLCLANNLKPKILTVTSNAWAGVPTFGEAPLVYGTTPDQVVTGTTTQTPAATTTGDTGSTPTWTGVVNMELTGAQSDFQRLIDAVDARPDMIISAYDIAPGVSPEGISSTSGNTTTNVVYSGYKPELNGGNITIKVTFTVYMVEK